MLIGENHFLAESDDGLLPVLELDDDFESDDGFASEDFDPEDFESDGFESDDFDSEVFESDDFESPPPSGLAPRLFL
jgi:hypothetical protein